VAVRSIPLRATVWLFNECAGAQVEKHGDMATSGGGSMVTGERRGSLEDGTCLSAAQEEILGEPTYLAYFPFLHLLFSLFLAERFFVGC